MLNFKLKNLYIFRASLDEVLKPPCGLFHRPLLSIYAKGQQALRNRLSTPGNENWVCWSYFICFSKSWCLRKNEFMHCSSPTNYCPIIIRLDYHVQKNQRKLIVLLFGWPFVNVIHCIGIVMQYLCFCTVGILMCAMIFMRAAHWACSWQVTRCSKSGFWVVSNFKAKTVISVKHL